LRSDFGYEVQNIRQQKSCMKISQKRLLILSGSILLVVITLVILFISYDSPKIYDNDISLAAVDEPWIEYLCDSTFKVDIDTVIHVYNTETGEKISTIDRPYSQINSLAMHPSGSHLLILGEYFLTICDLKKDDISNFHEDTTFTADDTTWILDDTASKDEVSTWASDENEISAIDMNYIEFIDANFFMLINFADAEVQIYRWPGLQHITTEFMGFYRFSFDWETKGGKLVFYYEQYRGSKAYYRTEFPIDSKGDSLFFTEPVLLDSLPVLAIRP